MAHRFYDSSRWRNIRASVLASAPLCIVCDKAGITTIATQVDHIIPIEQGGNPTAVDNLQSLCDSCHSKKTLNENTESFKIIEKFSYNDRQVENSTEINTGKRKRKLKSKNAQGSDRLNDNKADETFLI